MHQNIGLCVYRCHLLTSLLNERFGLYGFFLIYFNFYISFGVIFPWLQNLDGVNYFHVKVVGLLFVATTRINASPSLVLELLQRIARVIKDYLGVLNEDSLRKNFVLVYELLDEVIVSLLFFPYPFSGFNESTARFSLPYCTANHIF